jgi:general transcription factor 3C polypeptide 3 (transcription factor C subunit 4)
VTQDVAPQPSQHDFDGETSVLHTHQGISFDEWLELFLDYAIGLALEHRRDEAYQVCEAANDSTVFQSAEHKFTIHVAWSGTFPFLADLAQS